MKSPLKHLFLCLLLPVALAAAEPAPGSQERVRSLKITPPFDDARRRQELGEWGFAALVEVDGHRILFDTGTHTDVVLRNVQSLGIDLATVPEVVLSHNHSDHVGGFLTLRESVQAKAPAALGRTHVGEGIFYSRFSLHPGAEDNAMVRIKSEYEKTGGTFVVHTQPVQLYPGVWLTGPVPRKYPERNWSGVRQGEDPGGHRRGHRARGPGARFRHRAGVGGAGRLRPCRRDQHAGLCPDVYPSGAHSRVDRRHPCLCRVGRDIEMDGGKAGRIRPIGAHCTGIEPVYRFRSALGLDRAHAVVGAVGAVFELGRGIDPRYIAK